MFYSVCSILNTGFNVYSLRYMLSLVLMLFPFVFGDGYTQ